MLIVKLAGKTRQGKNRVREQGSEWHLVEVRERVFFSDLPGPWLLLAHPTNEHWIRWVRRNHDLDFDVLEVSGEQ